MLDIRQLANSYQVIDYTREVVTQDVVKVAKVADPTVFVYSDIYARDITNRDVLKLLR